MPDRPTKVVTVSRKLKIISYTRRTERGRSGSGKAALKTGKNSVRGEGQE